MIQQEGKAGSRAAVNVRKYRPEDRIKFLDENEALQFLLEGLGKTDLRSVFSQQVKEHFMENALLEAQCAVIQKTGYPTVFVSNTPEATARLAASFHLSFLQVAQKGHVVMATGNTMQSVYEEIHRLPAALPLMRQFIFTNLDEYFPCNPDAEHSFAYVLKRYSDLFDLPVSNRQFINGHPLDVNKEVERLRSMHESFDAKQSLGFAWMGIGPKGAEHIAFNEPGSPLFSECRVADLSLATIRRDTQRGQPYQAQAITLGSIEILKTAVLAQVMYGKEKGESLANALRYEPSSDRPASALLFAAHRWFVFADAEAMKELDSCYV